LNRSRCASEASSVTGSTIRPPDAAGLIAARGIRQIKRSVSTSNGTPLGPAIDGRLEHIDLRLTRIKDSLGEVREHLAFEEGRS
jgi:hypothetical protein